MGMERQRSSLGIGPPPLSPSTLPASTKIGREPPSGPRWRVVVGPSTAVKPSETSFANPSQRHSFLPSPRYPRAAPAMPTVSAASPKPPPPVIQTDSGPLCILSCGKRIDTSLRSALLPPGSITKFSSSVALDTISGRARRMAKIMKQMDRWQEVFEEFTQTKLDCMRHVARLQKEMENFRSNLKA
ncbi:hypothetical protein IAR50_006774 [Cryptococcus sp. DSM 104548]